MSVSISNDAATSKVDEADEKTTNKRELSSRDELSGAEANLPVKKRKIELSSQDKHYESEDESDSGKYHANEPKISEIYVPQTSSSLSTAMQTPETARSIRLV